LNNVYHFKKKMRASGVAQEKEHLPSKHNSLSLIPSIAKGRKVERKEGRKGKKETERERKKGTEGGREGGKKEHS
jgi:hypothetical protein